MRVAFVALSLMMLGASPVQGQGCGNLPCIENVKLNNTLHDLGHAGVGAIVTFGSSRLLNVPRRWDYTFGTVVFPVLAEVYDVVRWNGIERGCWAGCINWSDKANDFVSYQAQWAWYFVKEGKPVSAAYTLALYAAWIGWRWWYDPRTTLRASFWWHGAVAGAFMAGWTIVLPQDHPILPYVTANLFLTLHEISQLVAGIGDWADLASGLLLPAPYLLEM